MLIRDHATSRSSRRSTSSRAAACGSRRASASASRSRAATRPRPRRRFAAEARPGCISWISTARSGPAPPGLVERVADAGVPVQVVAAASPGRDPRRAGRGRRPSHRRDRCALDRERVEPVPRFGDKLVVAVDAKDGRVVAEGWVTESDVSPRELAQRCVEAGVRRLLVTSTRRDGSLAGPDTALLEEVLEAGLPVLAAGGIASLEDLSIRVTSAARAPSSAARSGPVVSVCRRRPPCIRLDRGTPPRADVTRTGYTASPNRVVRTQLGASGVGNSLEISPFGGLRCSRPCLLSSLS